MVRDSFVLAGANAYTLQGIPDYSGNILKAENKVHFSSEKPTRFDDLKIVNSYINSLDIAPWGDDNLFPAQAKEKLKLIPLAMRAMKFRINAHYGRGLILHSETATEENRISKIPIINDPIWNEFCRQSNLDITQYRIISDWEWFRNQFVEIILSNDGTKINKIFRQPAHFSRYKKLNPITYKSDACYVCSDWTSIRKNEAIREIPCLDWDNPMDDLRSYIKAGGKKRNFILPIKMEETDNIYYDIAYWTPILDTWAPIALTIPKVKQALLKNQMVLKFHIKIPFNYWSTKYTGWEDPNYYPIEKQNAIIKQTLDDMNEFLTDVDNTGKSFVSHYGTDKLSGKIVDEWKIEAIDNTKFSKDGQYITDAKAAKEEIVSAIGVDNTLLGGLGGAENGGGSNKREAFYILQAEMWADRMMTLKWFQHIKDYNGWNKDWTLGYMDIDTSQTLNENPTGSKLTV